LCSRQYIINTIYWGIGNVFLKKSDKINYLCISPLVMLSCCTWSLQLICLKVTYCSVCLVVHFVHWTSNQYPWTKTFYLHFFILSLLMYSTCTVIVLWFNKSYGISKNPVTITADRAIRKMHVLFLLFVLWN